MRRIRNPWSGRRTIQHDLAMAFRFSANQRAAAALRKTVNRRKRSIYATGVRSTSFRKRMKRSPVFSNRRTGGFNGIEHKFLDCAWNGTSITISTDGAGGEMEPNSGCTGALSVPSQGVGEQQRDGRAYTIKSVWCSGALAITKQSDSADVVDDHGCFFALVLDTQANAATIVSENVFINPSDNGIAMLPTPMRNLQYSKRYRILASQYVKPQGAYSMTDGASTASLISQQGPTFNLSWRGNIRCDTKNTTADVASATDNAIHLIAFNGGGFVKSIYAKSRVRFVG